MSIEKFKMAAIEDLLNQRKMFFKVPYRTRCGTTFMGSTPATEDATIVKKLRDGGAIIIGISNMNELGIGTTGNNTNR